MRDRLRFEWLCRIAGRTKPLMRLIALCFVALLTACSAASSPDAASPRPALPVHVSAARIARLPVATTYATTAHGSAGSSPVRGGTGTVLHPTTTRVIYTPPGGSPAAATLPATELGSPTWVPVVQSQPGWDRILLPTQPGRTGRRGRGST